MNSRILKKYAEDDFAILIIKRKIAIFIDLSKIKFIKIAASYSN